MTLAEPWPLPAAWRWQRFGDVARVASNLVSPHDYPDWPHVAPNHIESATGRLLPHKTVAADGVTSAKHMFVPGQVLYSKIRPYLAKVVVAESDGLCSADMYPIDTQLEARFLKWWMLTRDFTRLAAGEQARTILPKINVRSLEALPVPVPPVDEQRRIVDVLEDHLSRLDAARDYLRASRRRLASLEAAILNGCVAGDRVPLGELALHAGYGTSTKCVEGGPGAPVVRIPNLAAGRIDLASEKRAADPGADLRALMLEPDDLLIVRTNGSRALIGRTAVVQPGITAAFASYLIRYKLDPRRVRAPWASLMLSSPAVRATLESLAASSAGQYNLGLAKLNRVHIPVPALAEQDQALAQVEEQHGATLRLSEHIERARAQGDGLRSALLAAAFSGRL